MKKIPSLIVLFLSLFTPFLFAADVTEEFSKTYSISESGVLNLANISGDVTITGWERKDVEIRAIKRADSEKNLKDFWIEIDATANQINVQTKYAEKVYRRNPGAVDYEVHVPVGLELRKISLVNGDLSIKSTHGKISASSVNGQLIADGIGAAAKLSTVNGGLDVKLDRLNEGDIQISSVNGRIAIAVPKDSDVAFMASTLSGSIRNDFGFEEDGERFIGRKLRGTLGRGTARVELSNVNGPIVIRSNS